MACHFNCVFICSFCHSCWLCFCEEALKNICIAFRCHKSNVDVRMCWHVLACVGMCWILYVKQKRKKRKRHIELDEEMS